MNNNWMKFSLNDRVRVRVTDEGKRQLEAYKRTLPGALTTRCGWTQAEDEGGYSEWQLWVLMTEFGPLMRLGQNPPFETEILIPRNEEAKNQITASADLYRILSSKLGQVIGTYPQYSIPIVLHHIQDDATSLTLGDGRVYTLFDCNWDGDTAYATYLPETALPYFVDDDVIVISDGGTVSWGS